MSDTQTIEFTRGDSFAYVGSVPYAALGAGTWAAQAQLRAASGALVQQLGCALTPPGTPGDPYTLSLEAAAAQTAAWPAALLSGDVLFVDAGGVHRHTGRFRLAVVAPVTLET